MNNKLYGILLATLISVALTLTGCTASGNIVDNNQKIVTENPEQVSKAFY